MAYIKSILDMMSKCAVFLDRDGVLNRPIIKEGKPFSPRQADEFQLFEGTWLCLQRFREAGFLNIVVTNQPDIGRGLMPLEVLEEIHNRIRRLLSVDEVMFCPHDDADGCDCRKPKPGMLLQAAAKRNIDLSRSFMVGDQWKDMHAGKAAGCTTILIDYPYNQGIEADVRVGDLSSALDYIITTGVKR